MEGARQNCPADLIFDDQVFGLHFSAVQDSVACGLVNGQVYVFNYSPTENKRVLQISAHRKACRAVQFSDDGQRLFTVSTDGSIKEIDLNQGKITWGQGKAHESGINCMVIKESNIYTGDEDGRVKVWDDKSKKCIWSFAENSDYISDFAYKNHMLLCPSGDGTLSIFDLRKGKLDAMSDNMEDELLSITLVRNGTKVICGTQGGILDIFSWGNWGDISDRFPGHPESIDTIVPINENIICTGSSDGLIRVVNIFPNQLLGVVGEHEEFPIERLDISRDKNLLASCSHDCSVKFWNISYFWEEDDDAEAAVDGEEKEKQVKMDLDEKLSGTKLSKPAKGLKDFFSDL